MVMEYFRSISAFFDSTNWLMNALYGAICMIIPIVGPIVLMGYHVEVLHAGRFAPNAPAPDFTFDRFSEYLKKGLWPFLAIMVMALVITPVSFCAFAPFLMIPVLEDQPLAIVGLFLFAMLLYLVVMAVFMIFSTPVMLRAAFLQDFGPSFSWSWIKDFVKRMAGPLIISQLFLVAVWTVAIIGGYVMCFIGLYPMMAFAMFVQWHLLGQMYDLYLQRGGIPLPIQGAGEHCWRCSYDLRGNMLAATCPECGADLEGARAHAARPAT